MNGTKKFKSWIERIVPQQHCILCSLTSSGLICPECHQDFPRFELGKFNDNLLNMPKLRQSLQPLKFERLLALCEYNYPISKLVTGLKFNRKLPYAKVLANVFYQHCIVGVSASKQSWPQCIIPVPLHYRRYQIRQYNQVNEIALHLQKLTGIPVKSDLCKRNKSTDPQTELPAAQRKRNLKDAFDLVKPIEHQRVVVLDDVITTGATVNSLCACLKASHPNLIIEVWAMAISLGRQ